MFEHDCRNCSVAGLILSEAIDNMWDPTEVAYDTPVPIKRLKKQFKKVARRDGGPENAPRWMWHAVLNHAGSRDITTATYGELDSLAYEMEQTDLF